MTLQANALFCRSCAAALGPGMAACARCGQAIDPASACRVARRRPPLVTALAVLQSLGACLYLAIAAAMLSAFTVIPETLRLGDLAVPGAAVLLFGGIGVLHAASARGLWTLRRYGRTILRFFAILGLLAFPFGTIIALAVLLYLNTPGVKLLFSETPIEQLTAEQYAYVLATMRSPAWRAAAIVVCLLVGATAATIVTVGFSAPRLIRTRIAGNESRALETLRAFVAAETRFSVESGGFFGTPACLTSPSKCLRGYTGKALLARPGNNVFEDAGYIFQFTPGPAVDSAGASAHGQSFTRISRFALIAVPARPGLSGTRMFCVDATYRIRWAVGKPPEFYADACPPHWRVVGQTEIETQASRFQLPAMTPMPCAQSAGNFHARWH